ncbi:MAG: septal ring lytic transglycosylase RlpA family protein [Bacteroidales bacterium]|nr:septal ring lytic transglycosylase RlpA family protein [Bacteroidales bacterium]
MLGTYYSDRFVGRKTSNGEIFRQNQYTAAHRTIPFGTFLSVTYPITGQTIIVKVNDRCPKSNVLDMTKIACKALGIRGSGKVTVTTIPADLGQMLWAIQDTLALTLDEYLSFRDRSQTRRISPYSPCTKDGLEPPRPTAKPAPRKTTKPTITTDEAGKQPRTDTIALGIDTDSTTTAPTIPLKSCFDLELCTVSSNHAVLVEINRLPQELQGKVILEKNEINRDIRIILSLANTRSHAVRIQAELTDLFPESCVIPHVQ